MAPIIAVIIMLFDEKNSLNLYAKNMQKFCAIELRNNNIDTARKKNGCRGEMRCIFRIK